MPLPELSRYQKIKHNKGLCIEPKCQNVFARSSTRCHKCIHRRRKVNNPVCYTFNVLKNNARRRNKIFTITLCYFRLWCEATGYIELKGITADKYSIDRIDHKKGYEPGNLKMITVSENIKKRYVDYYNDQSQIPVDYIPQQNEQVQINTKEEESPW